MHVPRPLYLPLVTLGLFLNWCPRNSAIKRVKWPRKLSEGGLSWVQPPPSWCPGIHGWTLRALPSARAVPAADSLRDPLTLWALPERAPWTEGLTALPRCSPHFSRPLSLYPWDKCLIPQGVKGRINHPGEISQPADLAGERQREIGCLSDWLGPPLRGGKMLALRLQMGNAGTAESRPRHLGKSLLMRFWRRWLSPLLGAVLCHLQGPSLLLSPSERPAFRA